MEIRVTPTNPLKDKFTLLFKQLGMHKNFHINHGIHFSFPLSVVLQLDLGFTCSCFRCKWWGKGNSIISCLLWANYKKWKRELWANLCSICPLWNQMYVVYMGSSHDKSRDLLVRSHVQLLSSVWGRYFVLNHLLTHYSISHLIFTDELFWWSFLSCTINSRNQAEESLVNSYTYAFTGFSAKLSSQQANALSEKPEVISVFPGSPLELHTT